MRKETVLNKFRSFLSLPGNILRGVIWLYQKTLSPDHSFWGKRVFSNGYCKFYPSCSEYGRQAIQKRGIVVGSLKTVWRILRCNPWNKGGVDVPK
ncbi:MAG TPA: membrane protein insertion efficiency factor YidD [Candidatus Magasanikbacteria bacterium]|nr:MAG: membrane protein insertion efficiency factor YidD [Candidatus Magasanikbacteria bacterium RIFCSPLOWO2_02_FULL_47_16]OGH79632.1 MAG: membrane protein insertion efficiency factor YidD [Candidatus Magasanikbacteria bacterium RIFCSPHIGHO2_02_FULL_48_18]OGH82348.1 MAG: membrane protein insertion efficiency factor YidD [Candidatus Magasanikbacteria bacterium RIFCSPLOWO2_12_FULL_47_9b]HAZ28318.1 membrane protein insertion efficiency factor YidD [Candidatus Magasanikbacteria bacterium]